MEMILGSLADAGVDLRRIRIVPYPIDDLELLEHYVPSTSVRLLTIYDDWGEHKLRSLTERGLRVTVMWRRDKKITTGTEIPRLLRRTTCALSLLADVCPPSAPQAAPPGISLQHARSIDIHEHLPSIAALTFCSEACFQL